MPDDPRPNMPDVPATPNESERALLSAQLANAIALRSAQDSVAWSIFGTFWTTNAVLLVALFSSGRPPLPLVGVLISAVGVLLSIVWAGIQRRALGNMTRHEILMERIERQLGIVPSLAVSARLNSSDYETHVPKGPAGRTLMMWSGWSAVVGWFTGVVLFAVVASS